MKLAITKITHDPGEGRAVREDNEIEGRLPFFLSILLTVLQSTRCPTLADLYAGLKCNIDRQSAHARIRIANAKKNWTKPSKHISICGRILADGEIGIVSN